MSAEQYYSHTSKPCGTEGLFVGEVGAEVQVAKSDGQLLQKGANVSASAAELNRGGLKKATGALAAVDTGGGVFSWQNPESSEILIELVKVNVTTKTTAACTIDVGTTATNATTSSDNLIDGKDINAAAGTFDNIVDAGTNGKPKMRLAADKWLNGSVASGASAGLVGTYEVYYRVL
jgi:hypothetical protein